MEREQKPRDYPERRSLLLAASYYALIVATTPDNIHHGFRAAGFYYFKHN